MLVGAQTEVSPRVDALCPHNRNKQQLPGRQRPRYWQECLSLVGGILSE